MKEQKPIIGASLDNQTFGGNNNPRSPMPNLNNSIFLLSLLAIKCCFIIRPSKTNYSVCERIMQNKEKLYKHGNKIFRKYGL